MELLKGAVLVLGIIFGGHHIVKASGTCIPHLSEKTSDKMILAIEQLNPEILSGNKNPEQLYIDLKTEEAGWVRHTGYIDYNSHKLSEVQKQRILANYKIKDNRLETDYDFALFYMNQVRLLYVRVSNFIYSRILSASLGSVVTPRNNEYAKHIINSFFGHELTSVEMTTERFKETMKSAPWLMFPWSDAVAIFTAWEAQPVKGPRELDQFSYQIKGQYEGKIAPEHLELIFQSLRARDATKAICCKSGIGCQNCPLNRRFLLP